MLQSIVIPFPNVFLMSSSNKSFPELLMIVTTQFDITQCKEFSFKDIVLASVPKSSIRVPFKNFSWGGYS